MLIKTFKFNKKFFILFILCNVLFLSLIALYSFANNNDNDEEKKSDSNNKNFIKWVDFNVTAEAMQLTSKLDIQSHNENKQIKYNWIELLAYLACQNGGNFKNFKKSDLENLIAKLDNGKTIEDLTKNMKFYDYYLESYTAVLGGFIGNYSIENTNNQNNIENINNISTEKSSNTGTNINTSVNEETKNNENYDKTFTNKYGLKAFLPIAKNYSFSHYDDFGNSRSYGFKRVHLGNDLMGSIGTPVIAVESGIVEHLGWNQYGGWRVGIRSFDTKRYYYYAHLRKNHPYSEGLEEGISVKAGDVIGYLGMTGYSIKENVNNINIPHLHFGMQLIFDESQVDSPNEIWIDVYQIIEFLKSNTSDVYMSNT